MPRITKVYTRTGDDGTTALGSGQRVPKTAARIVAYGTVDELNACVGLALAAGPSPRGATALTNIQNELFHVGADLCIPEADKARCPGPTIADSHTLALERIMDELSTDLPPLRNFVLPCGTPCAAHLQHARAVCRRAERDVLTLMQEEAVSPAVVCYLNRLSDALFVLARYENHTAGHDEPVWDSRA